MGRSIILYSVFTALSFLLVQDRVIAQQQNNSAVVSKPPKSGVSFFVQGNYFGPKFTDINSVYRSIEQNFQLPSGKDFKGVYYLLAGVQYTIVPRQAIQGEFGVSIMKSKHDSTSNYDQLFSSGGSYIANMDLKVVSLYGGGGVSYLWLTTQRSYQTQLGIAHVNAQMIQLHALLGLEFFTSSGVTFSLEGRYLYGMTVWPQRSDLDINLKGITAGIRMETPILF